MKWRLISDDDVNEIREALYAPTHEKNDFNCQDWPIGQGCAGCDGDELRKKALHTLSQLGNRRNRQKREQGAGKHGEGLPVICKGMGRKNPRATLAPRVGPRHQRGLTLLSESARLSQSGMRDVDESNPICVLHNGSYWAY